MTLAEVTVAVAVTSILAGVAVSLLVGLRNSDRDMRRRNNQNQQLLRLAETMRADIRQAADVLQPTSDAIVLRAADEKLTRYELAPEGCRRIVTAPNDPTPRTDAFAVGPIASWTLAPGPPGRRPLFTVTLNRGDTDHEKPPLVLHAAAGADATP